MEETRKIAPVFVVIPTYNRCQDLLFCLDSLQKNFLPDSRIIVVDNASSDGTREKLHSLFPDVILIEARQNLGATGASNLGFARALQEGAAYILRLDSDTKVAPDFLDKLVRFSESNANSGIVSPKIYELDHPDVVWYAGAGEHPWHFGAVYDSSPPTGQPVKTDYIWATAMLIRAEVLEKAGGFDTDFLVYHEELDFCRRVRKLGFELWLVPEAKVWHKVGSREETPWRAYQWNRSKMIFFRKHARSGFHRVMLGTYAFAYVFARALFKKDGVGNRGPLKDALRGLWAGLRTPLSGTHDLKKEFV